MGDLHRIASDLLAEGIPGDTPVRVYAATGEPGRLVRGALRSVRCYEVNAAGDLEVDVLGNEFAPPIEATR